MRKWLFFLLFPFFAFAAENSILICENGEELLTWSLEMIDCAEESIEFCPCFFGGEPMQAVLHAFEKRLMERPKLRIHLLFNPTLTHPEDEAYLSYLHKRFADRFSVVQAYNQLMMDPTAGTIDNHMKFLIVDAHYYAMGGSNYSQIGITEGTKPLFKKPHIPGVPVDLPFGSRDQDIIGKGALAHELRAIFFHSFALWKEFERTGMLRALDLTRYTAQPFPIKKRGKSSKIEKAPLIPLGKGEMRLILGGPHQKKNAITAEYARLFTEARFEVWIANLYYNPPKNLFDVIKKGHVPFTIITNGVRTTSPPCNKMFCWAHRLNYVPTFYGRSFSFWERSKCQRAERNDNRLFEYDVKNIILHKKAAVIDEKIAVIGSYNLGTKSDRCDYELIVVIESQKAAKELKRILQRDLRHSQEITPKEAQKWYFDFEKAYLGQLQQNFNGFI